MAGHRPQRHTIAQKREPGNKPDCVACSLETVLIQQPGGEFISAGVNSVEGTGGHGRLVHLRQSPRVFLQAAAEIPGEIRVIAPSAFAVDHIRFMENGDALKQPQGRGHMNHPRHIRRKRPDQTSHTDGGCHRHMQCMHQFVGHYVLEPAAGTRVHGFAPD